MVALTTRARANARGLHRGRKAAYIVRDGRPITGPLYVVKDVKRALAAAGPGPVTVAAFTFESGVN